jgi:hypothetical protein
MRKIMLVIEDYTDLIALENLLRRVGFDVLSLGKDILVSDALLRFQPDIVIATSKGRVVDGLRVAARVKKQTPAPRVALAYTLGNAPSLNSEGQTLVDAMVVLPIQPSSFLKVMSQLAGIDAASLLSKYEKISTVRPQEEELLHVTGEAPAPVESRFVRNAPIEPAAAPSVFDEDPWAKSEEEWDPAKKPGEAATTRSIRSDRYDRFLSTMEEEKFDNVLPREKAAAAMRELKKASEKDKDKLEQLDRERREFVKVLFEDGESDQASKGKTKK